MSESDGAVAPDQLTSLISDEVGRQLRERSFVLEAMKEQMAKVLAEFEEMTSNVSSKRSWSNSVTKTTKPLMSPKKMLFNIHPVVTPMDIVPPAASSPPKLPKIGGGLLKSIQPFKGNTKLSGGSLSPGYAGSRSPDGKITFASSDTVLTASTTTFSDLPLHGDVGCALTAMRFLRPSPIQLHALPVALFGNDVIGQAKSGTGKTAVFGVTAVEHAIRNVEQRNQKAEEQMVGDPLALILAPTREIAVQIEAVLRLLAQFRPDIVIRTCIGGLPVAQDQMHLAAGCHIVVGTPGRVKALVDQCSLPCSAIRLLVLDEVDKLMARDFEKDVRVH
ncbi:hypothetical protein JG687_00008489 [Phytophthora cactorum]|uniref:P-loop containing nucleoside triphosphate hydrolase n=1 Tax=Phytophthora cactorum TaxID=29920 RepID=A0A8T1UC85_9STRA|nr:hypothetical protein JG687_00008489 [Phytophthora cactorum]